MLCLFIGKVINLSLPGEITEFGENFLRDRSNKGFFQSLTFGQIAM